MIYTMKIDVYDDDLFEDDAIGYFKVDLATLLPSGSIRCKVDNNIFAADVFLMMDYETSGWGNKSLDSQSITFTNIKVEVSNLLSDGSLVTLETRGQTSNSSHDGVVSDVDDHSNSCSLHGIGREEGKILGLEGI